MLRADLAGCVVHGVPVECLVLPCLGLAWLNLPCLTLLPYALLHFTAPHHVRWVPPPRRLKRARECVTGREEAIATPIERWQMERMGRPIRLQGNPDSNSAAITQIPMQRQASIIEYEMESRQREAAEMASEPQSSSSVAAK